jgi:Zn-dependent protease with chaperone function
LVSGYPATYNDGTTAARRSVTVLLDVNGLRLVAEDGRTVDQWRYEDLRLVDEVFGGHPLRFGLAGSEARLTFEGHGIFEDLRRRAPHLSIERRSWAAVALRTTAMTVAAIAVLAVVLWVGVPRAAQVLTRFVPVSWEVALGDKVMDQVIEHFKDQDGDVPRFCDGPAGRAVLDRLVAQLAAAADSPYDLRVAVLDHKMANGFALPGGQIVLFGGLLEFAETPQEVTAVVAHEIGHVVRRHTTQLILRNLGITFFFGVMLGDLGSGAIAVAGETLLTLSYSREAEAEADATAIQLLQAAALRADGLASFFARMEAKLPDMPAALALLSTHPSSEERAAKAAMAGTGGAALSPEDWAALKVICRG